MYSVNNIITVKIRQLSGMGRLTVLLLLLAGLVEAAWETPELVSLVLYNLVSIHGEKHFRPYVCLNICLGLLYQSSWPTTNNISPAKSAVQCLPPSSSTAMISRP